MKGLVEKAVDAASRVVVGILSHCERLNGAWQSCFVAGRPPGLPHSSGCDTMGQTLRCSGLARTSAAHSTRSRSCSEPDVIRRETRHIYLVDQQSGFLQASPAAERRPTRTHICRYQRWMGQILRCSGLARMSAVHSISRRFWRFIPLIAVVIALGCAPARKIDVPRQVAVSLPPSDITAEVNHQRALLRWKTNRGDLMIKGYNIYLDSRDTASDTTGLQIDRQTLLADDIYPGDTDPATDFETFVASDLQDGITYFAAVTTVYPDGTESEPSNTIRFICHPRGEFELAQRYSGEIDGFSFGRATYVPTDDLDNCIYYARIKGQDFLLSPSRLDNVLRRVEFFHSDITSVDDRAERPRGQGVDKIAVTAGDGCLLKTVDGEYAKLVVKALEGSGDDRIVRIKYSFMPVPNLLDF